MNSTTQIENSLEEVSRLAAYTNKEVQPLKRQAALLTNTSGVDYAKTYRTENETCQNNLNNMSKEGSRKKFKNSDGSALSVSSSSLNLEDALINKISEDMTVALPGATVEIDLELIHIEGKPDHLDDSDWCQHHVNQNEHFKFAMPNLVAPTPKLMYELDVYNMLKEYTLISDCSINSSCTKGKGIFDAHGFTMTEKNGGEAYANIPEKNLSTYKITVWFLAIKLLVKKKLAIVHPNGSVYRYVKGNYKNDICGFLLEACLHLPMSGSNTNINIFDKNQQGYATRAKSNALYNFQSQQECYDSTTADDQRMSERSQALDLPSQNNAAAQIQQKEESVPATTINNTVNGGTVNFTSNLSGDQQKSIPTTTINNTVNGGTVNFTTNLSGDQQKSVPATTINNTVNGGTVNFTINLSGDQQKSIPATTINNTVNGGTVNFTSNLNGDPQ